MTKEQLAERRREKVATVTKLRSTCTECGGPTPLEQKGRYLLPRKCECGGTGMGIEAIGAKLGLSKTTVGTLIADPTGEIQKQRKQKYKGVCDECSGPTDSKRIPRCGWCLRGERSPHLLANSPTRFADHFRRETCGFGGCDEPLPEPSSSAGSLMCPTHRLRLAPVRESICGDNRPSEFLSFDEKVARGLIADTAALAVAA